MTSRWPLLHLTEVRTSGTVSEFGCGIVVSSEECSREIDQFNKRK